MNKSTTNFLRCILLLGAFTSNIFGQHVGDIGVDANAAGRLTTHIVADGALGEPRRVFSARFGDTGVTNFTANPGFDAFPSAFHPSFRIGFNMRSPLLVWNGNGFSQTDSGGPTLGEKVKMSFLTANVTTAAVPVAGFSLAVQPDGGWHRHFSFSILPASGFATPDAGIYLLELELWPTDPSLSTSESFWIVMNYASNTIDHELAQIWVEDNLAANPCVADIDHDRIVGGTDLATILSNWGGSGTGDIDSSGFVDGFDLATLLSAWGACQ